jgi:hypothetical protein
MKAPCGLVPARTPCWLIKKRHDGPRGLHTNVDDSFRIVSAEKSLGQHADNNRGHTLCTFRYTEPERTQRKKGRNALVLGNFHGTSENASHTSGERRPMIKAVAPYYNE